MEEQRHDRLKRRLADLPAHEPSEKVWDSIAKTLANETNFHHQLQSLPHYVPPEAVWQKIENQLGGQQKSKFISLIVPLKKVAAAVLLLVGIFWFFAKDWQPDETVTYSTEVIQSDLQLASTASDEDAFQMVQTICAEKYFLCESPDFQLLKLELDELDAAKFSVETAIGDYNTNSDLMAELTQIELDRTTVLKKMLAYL